MKKQLAEIADQIEKLFPNGKGIIVYELKKADFLNIKKEFNILDTQEEKFKVDISGTEIVFILDELLNA